VDRQAGGCRPFRPAAHEEIRLPTLIKSVKAQGFQGLVAKNRKIRYEPGQRTGAWQKMRVNQGQELVIGGCTPSLKNFDALVIGYFDNGELMYAARTRRIGKPSTGVRTERCDRNRFERAACRSSNRVFCA
jgi:bifunctional non-homologous end joining protein LigD